MQTFGEENVQAGVVWLTMRHADDEDIGTFRGAMVNILCNSFDAGELRRFITRLPGAELVIPELPGDHAGLAELADAFVDEGLRQNIFDERLIDRLIAARPRRRADFESLRQFSSFLQGKTCGRIFAGNRRSMFELRVRLGRLLLSITLGLLAFAPSPIERVIDSRAFVFMAASVPAENSVILMSAAPTPPSIINRALAFNDNRVQISSAGECRVEFSLINLSQADHKSFIEMFDAVRVEYPARSAAELLLIVLAQPLAEAGFAVQLWDEAEGASNACDVYVEVTRVP